MAQVLKAVKTFVFFGNFFATKLCQLISLSPLLLSKAISCRMPSSTDQTFLNKKNFCRPKGRRKKNEPSPSTQSHHLVACNLPPKFHLYLRVVWSCDPVVSQRLGHVLVNLLSLRRISHLLPLREHHEMGETLKKVLRKYFRPFHFEL